MDNANSKNNLLTDPDTLVNTSTDVKRKSIDSPTVVPPLPEAVAQTKGGKDFKAKLKGGCYLVKFAPLDLLYHYDGTIRVENISGSIVASGDLYYHKPFSIWEIANNGIEDYKEYKEYKEYKKQESPPVVTEHDPGDGIPVFPLKDYRYYLRVIQLAKPKTSNQELTISFEMWKYNPESTGEMWINEGIFQAPLDFVNGTLNGYVHNSIGTEVAKLTMVWVSDFLRKATIEIDRVAESEPPLDNGEGENWRSVFEKVGWEMNVKESNNDVELINGEDWTDGEMHEAMLKRRDNANLDAEWIYHILVVKFIESTSRGIMYDAFATDSNNIPREGIGIASHWQFPDNNDIWGKVAGLRFGEAKAPYFRTALHEISHAMGLYHNHDDMGIMNTTDIIAMNAGPGLFPDNISWVHAGDDQKRLRHMPDIFVRPGGVPFGTAYSIHPLAVDNDYEYAEGLVLEVNPLNEVVPIGAPVRLEISLKNKSNRPLFAPLSLDMKFGSVKGTVTDAAGNIRTFSPLVICLDELPLYPLNPEEVLTNSITLLRGGEGALFPAPGIYTIEVAVTWDFIEEHVGIAGKTTVYIESAHNADHARAALKILTTPDTLLSLVLTGDHIEEGNDAIQEALNNPVLRPHYAYIEAKRLAISSTGEKKSNLKECEELLNEAIMNNKEAKKASMLWMKNKDNQDGGKPSVGGSPGPASNQTDNSIKERNDGGGKKSGGGDSGPSPSQTDSAGQIHDRTERYLRIAVGTIVREIINTGNTSGNFNDESREDGGGGKTSKGGSEGSGRVATDESVMEARTKLELKLRPAVKGIRDKIRRNNW